MNINRSQIQLADTITGPGRSTATLTASLQARFTSLFLCSGADVIASITAGLAELGRQGKTTAEGARLYKALLTSRAGANGNAIWTKLNLSQWTSGIYPTPVLDQLRNDLALLLSDDIMETLEALPIPGEMVGAEAMNNTSEVEFLDVLLGLWIFSREITRSIEFISSDSLPPKGSFTVETVNPGDIDGSILL